MARVRKIERTPSEVLAYIVDANFLVNKFIPAKLVPNQNEKDLIESSMEWWAEIDAQLEAGKAIVYVPDVCIAEAFKVLAKKYYKHKYFKRPVDHKRARDALGEFVSTPFATLRAAKRKIRVHDIPTSRDLIVSVDRFNELFLKHNCNVGVVDLIVLATAKYVMDFFMYPRARISIVTLDTALWRGSKKVQELPNAYHPGQASDKAAKVFE